MPKNGFYLIFFFITVKQPFFVIKDRHNLFIYLPLSVNELLINNNFEHKWAKYKYLYFLFIGQDCCHFLNFKGEIM